MLKSVKPDERDLTFLPCSLGMLPASDCEYLAVHPLKMKAKMNIRKKVLFIAPSFVFYVNLKAYQKRKG